MYQNTDRSGLRKAKVFIGDNYNFNSKISRMLSNRYEITACHVQDDTIAVLRDNQYDVIFLNEKHLNDSKIYDTAKRTSEKDNFPIIFIKNNGSDINPNEFIKYGGCSYISKARSNEKDYNLFLMNLIDRAINTSDRLNGIKDKQQILIVNPDIEVLDRYRSFFSTYKTNNKINIFTATTEKAAFQILYSNNISLTMIAEQWSILQNQLRYINRYKPMMTTTSRESDHLNSIKGLKSRININDNVNLENHINKLEDNRINIFKMLYSEASKSFILTGTTGSGKTTLCETITRISPTFRYIPPYISRTIREGEIHLEDIKIAGIDDNKEKDDVFIDYINHRGQLVRHNISEINRYQKLGKNTLSIVTDVETIDAIKSRISAIDVLITAEAEDINKRLSSRDGTGLSLEQITRKQSSFNCLAPQVLFNNDSPEILIGESRYNASASQFEKITENAFNLSIEMIKQARYK